MAENRGKQFERVVRKAFAQVSDTIIIRIPDQTNGFRGGVNICDLIVYHYPFQYCIECKSVHGNLLPFHNIEAQWDKLLAASKVNGVIAGVLCWWVDKDITKFIPIQMLEKMKNAGGKSLRYDIISCQGYAPIEIYGKKKRVFFDYDMKQFFEEVAGGKEN